MRKRLVLWTHRILIALGLLLVLSITLATASYIDTGVQFCSNANNFCIELNKNNSVSGFEIEDNGSYIRFMNLSLHDKTTNFTVGESTGDLMINSSQQVNLTLEDYRTNHVKLTGDSADGNNVTFTLCNLTKNEYFTVYKDDSKVALLYSGDDGCIEYSNDEWSTHTFEIIFTTALTGGSEGSPWNPDVNPDIPSSTGLWEALAPLLTLAVIVTVLSVIILMVIQLRGGL